jgi:hypothetical protein
MKTISIHEKNNKKELFLTLQNIYGLEQKKRTMSMKNNIFRKISPSKYFAGRVAQRRK